MPYYKKTFEKHGKYQVFVEKKSSKNKSVFNKFVNFPNIRDIKIIRKYSLHIRLLKENGMIIVILAIN